MRRLAPIVAVLVLAGCDVGGEPDPAVPESEFPPTDTGVVTGELPEGGEVPIVLDGLGTAVLTPTDGQTRVILPEGVDGQIVEGTCEQRTDEVLFELGEGETVIDQELTELIAARAAIVSGDVCAEIISPGQ